MKLFGLSGTNGAGKDTVAEYLQEQGYLYISVSDLLRQEARKRKLPIERTTLSDISAEWRRQDGLGVLVDKAIDAFEKDKQQYKGLVVGSLRNSGEAIKVHELDGQVVWVDADSKVRYERIFSRQRTAEDNKTFAEFCADEKREMSHSGDEATLNMASVKQRADIFLTNNGSDIDAFKRQLKGVFQ